ncbi:hypothetical protein [Mycolicibacterium neworleansense]|uniref:Uncharacterized protein n=1 Tax=Mycolicibacterium neworleansense TaxID=146018 RepID=A0A0H5RUZ2_9MYCO|nr:hypothetical protein [Mycolicibacterium neworleansense]MCV7360049.1 hypothetical protein [Mycolicibacterium neworleansense]CRZ17347.1 hypothetical protein BN2156_04232 [Mycolicibacterium neworleansense]
MDLIWWAVAITGCIALAGCVGLALLPKQSVDKDEFIPLANTRRLTLLPEYVRAVRRRTVSAVVAMVTLTVAFAASALVAARPTGLPSWSRANEVATPEDIMVCVGGPLTDPAVGTTLRYFADRVGSFGTERVGLTSANRRVIPLTRDYQYAAAQFASFGRREGSRPFVAPVSYVDYAASVEDVLALCLTGFPSFSEPSAQRRSIVYVGPESLPRPGEVAPLFGTDRLRDLAVTAGVQVNAITPGSGDGPAADLARSTGGRWFSDAADVDAHLDEIRDHPPQAGSTGESADVRSAETPGVPVLLASLAMTVLWWWPVVMRR